MPRGTRAVVTRETAERSIGGSSARRAPAVQGIHQVHSAACCRMQPCGDVARRLTAWLHFEDLVTMSWRATRDRPVLLFLTEMVGRHRWELWPPPPPRAGLVTQGWRAARATTTPEREARDPYPSTPAQMATTPGGRRDRGAFPTGVTRVGKTCAGVSHADRAPCSLARCAR